MKNNESGRSLLEMLGVLALGGILSIGAVSMYQGVRARQMRFVAEQELRRLAENARLLYSGRRNFTGITKNFLIKSGAIRDEEIMGHAFRIQANDNGQSFSVIFEEMNKGDCAYFATRRLDWAYQVRVNGFADRANTMCSNIHPNRVEFVIR